MLKTKLMTVIMLSFFVFGSYTWAIEDSIKIKQDADDKSLYKKLELLANAITLIQSDYVEETGSQELIYGALDGMLSSLDLHSQFLNPDAYQEIKVETEGEFGGLGIVITIKDKVLTIVSPLEDTPAYKAGLEAGDIIVEIEGESTKDINLTEAVKKLRGEPGTTVSITIVREEEDKILKFDITRDIIKIKSVKESRILEDNIGYVKLLDFQEDTAKEMNTAIENLIEEGMDSLILDLRNNPGGLLDVAVMVSERFVPEGQLVVYTKGRKDNQSFDFTSGAGKKYTKYPLVVLVNKGSASGSEIVAGAIQDHKTGIILGKTTFGKGSVQTVIPLADNSAIRLTTSKYFTPNGRSIHNKGIVPDVEVEYEKISKDDEPKEKGVFKRLEQEEQPQDEIADINPKESDVFEYDSQLVRAIDLLKAIKVYKQHDSVKTE